MTPALRRRLLALLIVCAVPAGGPAHGAMIGDLAIQSKKGVRIETELDYSLREIEVGGGLCCLDSEALRLMLRIAGRAHERVELFGRIGGVLVHGLHGPGPTIDGSAAPAIGGGFKAMVYEQGKAAFGAGAQVLFHGAFDEGLHTRIQWHEIDLFAGPSVAVRPDLRLYGGLLASIIEGELTGPGGALDLDERQPWGMFLGGRAQVTRAVAFELELRMIDELAIASRVGINF